MSLMEELIQNHLFESNCEVIVAKFLFYISNKYEFIDYNKLNFSCEISDDYKFIVSFDDKYTQYVLSEDFKKVERLHKIYKLTGQDIIAKFNTLRIEHTITLNNNNDF